MSLNRKDRPFKEIFRVGNGTLQDPLVVWLTSRPRNDTYPGYAQAVEEVAREACRRTSLPMIYIRSLPHNETSKRSHGVKYTMPTDRHITVFLNRTYAGNKTTAEAHEYWWEEFHFSGHVFTVDDPNTGNPLRMAARAERPITGPLRIPNPELWNVETEQKVWLPLW